MMKENDLKRNGSGYIDEPCYKTVTAPPRPGEIWNHSRSGKPMLVLANAKGICTTLLLQDKDGEGAIPVMGRTMMYTKPAMIGYCFEDLLTDFVKSVKGEEMALVKKGVVKALGLLEAVKDDVSAKQEELESLKAGYLDVCHENEKLKAQLAEAKAEKIQPNAMEKEYVEVIKRLEQEMLQLNVYKDMYMEIIGKLVSMRGGMGYE